MRTKKRSQAGQTLIEIIIATGVVALVMTAIVSVMTVSLFDTAQARSKAVATKYTQEGLEFFRRQRNELGWEAFLSNLSDDGVEINYCLPSIPQNTTQFVSLSNTPCADDAAFAIPNNSSKTQYFRQANITIQQVKTKTTITVTVTVTWKDGAKTRTSTSTQKFEHWSSDDAPPPPSYPPTVFVSPMPYVPLPPRSAWTATAQSTDNGSSPANAIDGNLGSNWNAGGPPTKWIEVDLSQPSSILAITLTVNQSPAGVTTHNVYAGLNSADTLVHTFNQNTTGDDILATDFFPALNNVRYIRIETVQGPSWVSWKEIDIR